MERTLRDLRILITQSNKYKARSSANTDPSLISEIYMYIYRGTIYPFFDDYIPFSIELSIVQLASVFVSRKNRVPLARSCSSGFCVCRRATVYKIVSIDRGLLSLNSLDRPNVRPPNTSLRRVGSIITSERIIWSE